MHESGYKSNEDFRSYKEDLNTKERSSENFFFSENADKVLEKRREIDNKVESDVKIFVGALDSYQKGLTNKLLEIYGHLEKIGGMDKTTLWNKSFDILLSNKDVYGMPDKLKNILWEMLKNLTKYDKIKMEKSKPLEKMLIWAISVNNGSCSSNLEFGSRTFVPGNFSNLNHI